MSTLRDIDLSIIGMNCRASNTRALSFKENTELFDIANTLLETMSIKITVDPDNESLITGQLQDIQGDPEFAPIFSRLDKLAGNLALNFTKIRSILNNEIQPLVTSLEEQIKKVVDRYLIDNGMESIMEHTDIIQKTNPLQIYDWNIPMLEPNTALEILRDGSDIAFSNGFVVNDITAALGRIPNKINTLSIPVETENTIITQLKNNSSLSLQEYTPEMLLEIWQTISSDSSYQKLLGSIRVALANETPFTVCKFFASLLQYVPVKQALMTMDLSLSEETSTLLSENFKAFQMLQCVLEFYIRTMRTQCFANMVVLDSFTVNRDAFTAFENNGSTMEDIWNHIKLWHILLKERIPNYGISGEFIQSNQLKTKERLAYAEANLDKERIYLRNQATIYGFQNVLTEYLKNIDESNIPEYMSRNQYINHGVQIIKLAQITAVHQDGCLEEGLYQFLIKLKYDNTLVATAYKYCAKCVIKMLDGQPTSTIADIDTSEIDARVGSQIMLDFLVSNFLKM